MKVTLDFETRSRLDLEFVGSWIYTMDCEPLMVAWKVDDGTTSVENLNTDAGGTPECPDELRIALENPECEVHAHNVLFEYGVLLHQCAKKYGWPMPALHRFHDTMAAAMAFGLPGGLDNAGKALELSIVKDSEGKRLISYFSKPISSGHRAGSFRACEGKEYNLFLEYCRRDVESEHALANAIPAINPREQLFFTRHFAAMVRGIRLDRSLIRGLEAMTDTGREVVGRDVTTATNGEITGATVAANPAALRSFICAQGVEVLSVDKKAVAAALQTLLPEPVKVVLEARQTLGKSSNRKLAKMTAWMDPNDRAHGILAYHAAGQTGRDGGRGPQFQNLPRGEKLDHAALINAAIIGDTEAFLNNSWVKRKDGTKVFDPMGAVATCLRGCIAAKEGCVFYQCDWSAIEARGVNWLAEQEDILEVFRKYDAGIGPDVYKVTAAAIACILIEAVTDDLRQMGKVVELGAGYAMSADKLVAYARDTYGLKLTPEEAEKAIGVYRVTHRKVVAYWSNLETAAKMAIRRPGVVYSCGRVAYRFDGQHLQCRLPSGRLMTYPFATIKPAMTSWGELRDQIHFYVWTNKHWVEETTYGGKLCENVTQGTCRDLMRDAVIRLEDAGYPIVLRVHDELVAEVDINANSYEDFKRLFLVVPDWATGLPLNGGGWIGPRYKKG